MSLAKIVIGLSAKNMASQDCWPLYLEGLFTRRDLTRAKVSPGSWCAVQAQTSHCIVSLSESDLVPEDLHPHRMYIARCVTGMKVSTSTYCIFQEHSDIGPSASF